MGIKKLEAVLYDQFDDDDGYGHASINLYRRMFRAFAAPDDSSLIWTAKNIDDWVAAHGIPPNAAVDSPPADGPKPEAGPRRMRGNPACPSPNYHLQEHDEISHCTLPGFQPCVPVEAKPAGCEHEWHDRSYTQPGETWQACSKCGRTRPMPDRPAPPTPEQLAKTGNYELTGEYRTPVSGEWAFEGHPWPTATHYLVVPDGTLGPRYILRPKPAPWVPQVGEWVYCDNPLRGKPALFRWGPFATFDEIQCPHCRAATDADKYRPGAEEIQRRVEINAVEAKPAKLEPKVGEWWWHNKWARPVKIISVDPVMISVAAYLDGKPFESGPDYLKHKCTPGEMFRPGARVRVTSSDGDLAECRITKKGFSAGYVWISIFGYEDGFVPERVTLLDPEKEI